MDLNETNVTDLFEIHKPFSANYEPCSQVTCIVGQAVLGTVSAPWASKTIRLCSSGSVGQICAQWAGNRIPSPLWAVVTCSADITVGQPIRVGVNCPKAAVVSSCTVPSRRSQTLKDKFSINKNHIFISYIINNPVPTKHKCLKTYFYHILKIGVKYSSIPTCFLQEVCFSIC